MTTKYLDENGLRHLLSEIRSDVTPIKDGTAAVGTSKKLAKADHVHPKVTPSDIGAAASSHTHGNITSGGALQTNDVTVANGDKLVVADLSDSNKVARTSIAFDGSTASKALTQKGTFEDIDNCNVAYGTCSTGANETIRVVTLGDGQRFTAKLGSVISVYFVYDLSGGTDTSLSITDDSGTEQRFQIRYQGSASLPANLVHGGSIVTFVLGSHPSASGTYAHILSVDAIGNLAPMGQGSGTCSTDASTAAKTVNISSFRPAVGGIFRVTFSNAVPANATLNVSSTGAKNIRYLGSNITAGIIKAGDSVTFATVGNYYYVIGIDRLLNAVSDVQIDSTSVVSGGVATIPKAGSSAYGVITLSYSSSPVARVKIQGVGGEFQVPELDSDGLIDPDGLPEATTSTKGALSATDKTKLDGIAEGAEVNVQSDWNQTTTTADDYIKNKPTSMTPTSHSHGYISNDGKITNVGAVTGNVWRFIMADAGGNLYRAGTPFDDSSDKAKNVLKQSGVFEALEATDIWYDTNVTVGDAIDSKAPKASPAFTGTPTAPTATAGTNTTQIATTAFVSSAISTAITGAVAYKGTVPITGQTGGFAPTNTTAGWYWIVQSAGTYAGVVCEAGDMIFCKTASSTYSASNFDVIQTNLDIATMTNAEIESAISA